MLSNSVKTALVYTYITGNFPKNIHLDTWSRLYDLCDGIVERVLKPEALEYIKDHPFKVAHDYLTGLGFYVKPNHFRGTSHYVNYIHPENEDEASAYRSGGVTIRPFVDKPPYLSKNISHEQIISLTKTD